MHSDDIAKIVTEQEFYAIAKTAKGKASDIEQKLAIQTIAIKMCRLNGQSFDPNSERMTAFNEGMRYIGRMILKMDQMESDYFVKLKSIKKLTNINKNK